MNGFCAAEYPVRIGVAVSGGGDSVALLSLMADWGVANGVIVHGVTVDHGLRPEAADEADMVAQLCSEFDLPHQILKWEGWDRRGNLQDQARRARIGLINEWAKQNSINTVATGHTLDDQAETVLMRLGRGAGVDGLSGIPAERHVEGIRWIRPLLALEREELRAYLRDEDLEWAEDPSNEDPQFERVRIRQAMGTLAELGISTRGLAATADRMASARAVLEISAEKAAQSVAKSEHGQIFFDADELMALPTESRRRLLRHALNWVSGAEYGPRAQSLADLEDAIRSGRTATLHGCLLAVKGNEIVVTREFKAVASTTCKITEIWDNRWKISGDNGDDLEIRALGEHGLLSCPDWREMPIPRTSLIATPSVWRDDELIAAPLAGFGQNWRAELVHDENDFFSSILTH